FPERVRFIGALVHQVTIDIVGLCWLQMVIEWKIPEWGIDTGYMRKSITNGAAWRDEEQRIFEQMYPTEEAIDVLKALPTRTWKAIHRRAEIQGIARVRDWSNSVKVWRTIYDEIPIVSIEYAEVHGLDPSSEAAQWDTQVDIPDDGDDPP